MQEFWQKGERSKLSKLLSISLPHLSEILHRRRGVGKERAKLLEKTAKRLKKEIPFEAWLFNRNTKHPAFFGKPIK